MAMEEIQVLIESDWNLKEGTEADSGGTEGY